MNRTTARWRSASRCWRTSSTEASSSKAELHVCSYELHFLEVLVGPGLFSLLEGNSLRDDTFISPLCTTSCSTTLAQHDRLCLAFPTSVASVDSCSKISSARSLKFKAL